MLMIDFKYRPDVDGLRAVAVVLVLLFHANLGFSGGYVGVDIFFVISGFLITGLILKQQDIGSFRLRDFWLRRIRRILPASTVMVIVTLVVGYLMLMPDVLEQLGEATVAQQCMLSNVYFWRNTGYFDGAADLKPLLHTWSLAVEEQFYIGYPFLLVLLARWNRHRGKALVLSILLVASLSLSVWGVSNYPTATFFLLPTRAWELLVGAMICFAPAPVYLRAWQTNLLSGLGLGGMLAAGWLFDATTPFPGIAALLPCLGAAVFIYANTDRLTSPGRWLAAKPVVFVGLISYSLYLWHWPVLTFYRNAYGETLPMPIGAALLAVSFGLGYLSWRFVETPFRRAASRPSTTGLLGGTAVVVAVLLVAGGLFSFRNGFPERFGPRAVKLFATMKEKQFRHTVTLENIRAEKVPSFGSEQGAARLLVWGDSHAMALMPAIHTACVEAGIRGYQATHDGTLPLLGFDNNRHWAAPLEFNDAVLEFVVAQQIEVVLLTGYWSRESNNPNFAVALTRTLQALIEAGCEVVIVQDVPDQVIQPGRAIGDAIQQNRALESLGITLAQHRSEQQAVDNVLLAMQQSHVQVVDPAPFLADEEQRCRIVMDDEALYWDNHHLTVAGAHRLVPMFNKLFGELFGELQRTPHRQADRAFPATGANSSDPT